MNKKILVSILLSLISFAACQTCGQAVLEIMLVVDSSGSMGTSAFALEKNAVVQMINLLNNTGGRKFKVGVINYSSTVQTISSVVDTDHIKARIIANVNNMPYLGGMRATGDALARARQIYSAFALDGVPRVLVLFTDGATNMGVNVITEADLLKNQLGVNIFTVGIGSQINHAELNAISSIPLSTYKKTIANYQEIYAAINEITWAACRTPAFILPGKTVLVFKAVPR
jgi:uncharacterized protein YegL